MNRENFILALNRCLAELPEADRIATVEYYAELIGDKMDSGLTEEQAVAELEAPEVIAQRLLSEGEFAASGESGSVSAVAASVSEPAETGAGTQPRQSHRTAFLVVLLCTFPFWIGPAAAAFGILIAFYATILALTVGGLAMFVQVPFAGSLTFAGLGICAIGLALLLTVGTVSLTKLAYIGVKKLFRWGLELDSKSKED